LKHCSLSTIPVCVKPSATGQRPAGGVAVLTKTLPVESEDRLAYRIKSPAETFERTADESELTLPWRA